MKYLLILLLFTAGCQHTAPNDPLALIQIQDRNGLTETISNPDRLTVYQTVDFLTSQPYKKVLRVYKANGKNHSKITTYHSNGSVFQYLEGEEMRAHGAYREWFPNGQLKIDATVIGGTADVSQQDWLFDGLSQVWDEQGHLTAKIPYEKGALEGSSLYFYPSGQLEREVPFVKNNMEGALLEFSPQGQLKSKTGYKKGLKEGESQAFFESGQLALVEDYTEGYLRTGKYYNLRGDLVSEIEHGGGFQGQFENGCLTLIEFRMGRPDGLVQKFAPSGEIQKSFHLKNGKKQGEEVEYYLKSQIEGIKDKYKPRPKLSVSWNENAIHGTVKTWYNDGQLQSQREYSRNQRTGPSLAWFRDGALMLLEEYEEDRLVSGQYFKPNRTEPVSTIANGTGVATLYDETGAFLRKVQYLKGKTIDPEN